MGALALAYFVAGKLGLCLAYLEPSASPVWPPAGIAFAALLVLGSRAWPAIFIGAFFVNLTTAGNLATSFCIAIGNTLEALCGVWLVNRFAGGIRVFDRAQEVFKFVPIAALSTAISPSIGLTSLAAGGFVNWGGYSPVWFTWWLGDMTGYLVVGPLVLLWWIGPRWEWTSKKSWELALLLILLVAIGEIVFGGWFSGFMKDYPIAFICTPIILWTAFRFAQREAATGVFILSGIALWGTLHHEGPFHLRTDNQSLLTLQSWAGVLTLTSMALAAAMAERRRTEAELEEQKVVVESANRTKDRFLAMLSHELRAPLMPVIALLDVLQMDPEPTEEWRSSLTTIRRNIELESRLIDDLLDLTRIARGKWKLEFESIDAHEAVLHVLEICQPEMTLKRVRLGLDLLAHNSWVAADPTKFKQIIWNLLKNAVKFTPENGEINVSSTNPSPGELSVVVRDTGVGIEPDKIGRVFEPFEQGDEFFQRRHGGLGLGLAISKAIAEGHGGSLVALSDGPGRGATFLLTMTTVRLDSATQVRTKSSEDTRCGLRILLVDDDADTCAAMAKSLTRHGHSVVAKRDVRSAMEAIEGDRFDLLITDIGLPDGTGLDLMGRLRGSSDTLGIAISGFGMSGDVSKSLAAGFSEHVVKPVSLEKLNAAIERAMNANDRK